MSKAIDSVLAQTFRDFEIIVIDDASTDDTPERMRSYADRGLVTYHRIDHRGATGAKNEGMRRARGRYVALLDSDDLWHCEKLERQLSLFRQNPDLEVVYTRRQIIDPAGCLLEVDRNVLHRGSIAENLLLDNFVCCSSVLVARSVLDHVGLMDESIVIPSDYDLWLRISLHYGFDYVDLPVTFYRNHPGISRKTTAVERRSEIDLVTKRFLDEYGGKNIVRQDALRSYELQRLCSIGWAYRPVSRLRSMKSYIGAIRTAPLYRPAWLGLGAAMLPEVARRLIRILRSLATSPPN